MLLLTLNFLKYIWQFSVKIIDIFKDRYNINKHKWIKAFYKQIKGVDLYKNTKIQAFKVIFLKHITGYKTFIPNFLYF